MAPPLHSVAASARSRRVGPIVAEDLAAETFLHAFRARGGYRDVNESALPWLYGIVTNLIRGHRRSELRRTEALGRMAGWAVFDRSGEDRIDDSMAAAAAVQHLASVFAGLSNEARDVLVLVAIEDLTYEQAAAALDVPVGTVRSRLSRACIDLRRALSLGGGPATELDRTISRFEEIGAGARGGVEESLTCVSVRSQPRSMTMFTVSENSHYRTRANVVGQAVAFRSGLH